MAAGRCEVDGGRCKVAAGRCKVAAGRCKVATGRCEVAADRCNVAACRYKMAAGRFNVAASRCEGQEMRLRTVGAAVGLVALLGVTLLAQSPPPGKLNGTVVDTSDAVMPGVSIVLRGPESRSTVSDRNGAFAFTALPLGDYELRVSLDGFATVVRTVTVTNSSSRSGSECESGEVQVRSREWSAMSPARCWREFPSR